MFSPCQCRRSLASRSCCHCRQSLASLCWFARAFRFHRWYYSCSLMCRPPIVAAKVFLRYIRCLGALVRGFRPERSVLVPIMASHAKEDTDNDPVEDESTLAKTLKKLGFGCQQRCRMILSQPQSVGQGPADPFR